ncbi:MAG: ABC transporter substrate binding protein, partial [Bradyrhizobium sp.]
MPLLRIGNAAAGVHHTHWRYSGGMAARGARAATRWNATHRSAHESLRGRSGSPGPGGHGPGGLAQLGWIDGRNLHIDYRWSGGDIERIHRYAAELVALAPDVILAYGGSVVGPLQQVTRTVPIVFVEVIDPVGAGFVTSLARPGGN